MKLPSALAKRINFLFSKKKFTNSKEYWERRYQKGGDSGPGSYEEFAEFKAEMINQFVSENGIETVIEFGSGDGNQLKYFHFKSYLGLDISSTIVSKCRKIYNSDPTKKFKVLDEYNGEMADLVLSLDVIYHLVEDKVFSDHMEKVFSSSKKFIIIYSGNDPERDGPTVNHNPIHVKHRRFTDWIDLNAPQFELIRHIPNDNRDSSPSDLYFYKIKVD